MTTRLGQLKISICLLYKSTISIKCSDVGTTTTIAVNDLIRVLFSWNVRRNVMFTTSTSFCSGNLSVTLFTVCYFATRNFLSKILFSDLSTQKKNTQVMNLKNSDLDLIWWISPKKAQNPFLDSKISDLDFLKIMHLKKLKTNYVKTIPIFWARLSKISLFVSGEQINNWSERHWQITIFCDKRVQ